VKTKKAWLLVVVVAGLKWFPKSDVISLDISELNFGCKMRGKKSTSSINVIPERLTRRHCVSKIGKVFDRLGRVTPITACFKLDLHELVIRHLDWDDVIPDGLREVWINNFRMIQDINQLKYRRTIVPPDAVNLELNTLQFADASHSLVCVAIYARFKRRSGGYSSQLICHDLELSLRECLNLEQSFMLLSSTCTQGKLCANHFKIGINQQSNSANAKTCFIG